MIIIFSDTEFERVVNALTPWPNEAQGIISEAHVQEFTNRCKEEVMRFIEQAEQMKDEPQVWTGVTNVAG